MVEPKSPVAKTRAAAAKVPVGRFYELQQEVTPVEPYVLTENISVGPLTRRQVIAMEQTTDETAQEQIIFGENYDAVLELFADQPFEVWRAFTLDINRHLFGAGVEQAPGKSEESSSS